MKSRSLLINNFNSFTVDSLQVLQTLNLFSLNSWSFCSISAMETIFFGKSQDKVDDVDKAFHSINKGIRTINDNKFISKIFEPKHKLRTE